MFLFSKNGQEIYIRCCIVLEDCHNPSVVLWVLESAKGRSWRIFRLVQEASLGMGLVKEAFIVGEIEGF